MSPDQEPEYVTLGEAARLLGFSPRTLERWVESGRIPFLMTAEGERIFPLRELREHSARIDPSDMEDSS